MLINFIRTYSEKMASFRSKIPAVQAARTVLAIATLTVLISTSWESLTPEIAGLGRPSYCEPPLSLGLFCMDASADKFYARGFAVLVLILVALGCMRGRHFPSPWVLAYLMAVSKCRRLSPHLLFLYA
jgi:hypothetical protein